MFYAVEIDACPAYGWQGGPTANVLIKTLANRHEKRNKQGDLMQHTYSLPFQNIPSDDYLAYIKAAYMAVGGPTDSFLTKDYGDFQADEESLGVAPAGSTPVQLYKTYSFQGVAYYQRPITKPVAGVVVRQNGVIKSVTVDVLTGLVTPTTAWTPGSELTWTGEFRVPVRFNSMTLPSTIDNRAAGRYAVNGSVELIEVFGE